MEGRAPMAARWHVGKLVRRMSWIEELAGQGGDSMRSRPPLKGMAGGSTP